MLLLISYTAFSVVYEWCMLSLEATVRKILMRLDLKHITQADYHTTRIHQ